ncbi:MAG TPA: putative metal-binding motif-containing protein [Kofleriaceae bacterium]|nr:putative metal-binding motif-containing protein [Kofleriaceae bacterium]
MTKPLRLAIPLLLLIGCAGDEQGDDDTGDCASPQMVFPDGDGDGYGDMTAGAQKCAMPDGWVARGGDCADDDAAIHPEAAEICDAVDNNCDGKTDDADSTLVTTSAKLFYRDGDGDGFGDAAKTKYACVMPSGYALNSMDCNDTLSSVHPGAAEVCDQLDNDCDSLVDAADPGITDSIAFYKDLDHDGIGAGTATYACQAPSGYVLTKTDCNDNDNTTYPGAAEICDSADNDCDGGIDGTPALQNRCTGLVGTYTATYSHLTQEKLGSTVINSMSCSGTGSPSLVLTRKPALQGTFTCNYSGGLGGFDSAQKMVLNATVGVDGTVKGTVDHTYDDFGPQHRVYNVTGTQTATGLTLSGTGSWYPNPQSAVPWTVSFSVSGNK